MRHMPCRSGFCNAVVTIEVVAPLAPTLNGGTIVFSQAVALELGSEVGCGEAYRCRHAHHRRSARLRWQRLWGPTGMVSPPPSMRWHVDRDDDELVDVIAPLPPVKHPGPEGCERACMSLPMYPWGQHLVVSLPS
jgi:hypothetical protein